MVSNSHNHYVKEENGRFFVMDETGQKKLHAGNKKGNELASGHKGFATRAEAEAQFRAIMASKYGHNG
jgi:hypothetical protein